MKTVYVSATPGGLTWDIARKDRIKYMSGTTGASTSPLALSREGMDDVTIEGLVMRMMGALRKHCWEDGAFPGDTFRFEYGVDPSMERLRDIVEEHREEFEDLVMKTIEKYMPALDYDGKRRFRREKPVVECAIEPSRIPNLFFTWFMDDWVAKRRR
jgi:hypothetical protein